MLTTPTVDEPGYGSKTVTSVCEGPNKDFGLRLRVSDTRLEVVRGSSSSATVYRLAVRTTEAVRATLTPTPLLMRRMMPVRLPTDDLRRIAGCPWKNRWMPQLCGDRGSLRPGLTEHHGVATDGGLNADCAWRSRSPLF